MSKFLSSICIVSGTAIGSGLISLPLSASRLGIEWTLIITLLTLLVTYWSSCMTIDLMKSKNKVLSIVELASQISGPCARILSMISLYSISLALICAYFAGTCAILDQFFDLGLLRSVSLSFVMFVALFSIKKKLCDKVNSLMTTVLFALIFLTIFFTINKTIEFSYPIQFDLKYIALFLPIICTSFGVQNVCPFVVSQIGLDNSAKAKKAFLIGILIPAIIYILWIVSVISRVYHFDPDLYGRMIAGQVEVGELVSSLCNSVKFGFGSILLKLLTLFAIITSATGTGIGFIISIKEIFTRSYKVLIPISLAGLPTLLTLVIPNAFMRILSFGGMISTIFTIFIPSYLSCKIGTSKKPIVTICIIFGLSVVLSELFNKCLEIFDYLKIDGL